MNDSLRDAIASSTDLRLDNLMEMTELAVSVAASYRKRVRSLTKDTSTALEHTWKGLVELVKYLFICHIDIHIFIFSLICPIGKIYSCSIGKSILQSKTEVVEVLTLLTFSKF